MSDQFSKLAKTTIAAYCQAHPDEATLDQAGAVKLMTRRGYLNEAAAARRWPGLQLVATQPPLYYVGLLELRELVRDLRAAQPDWSEQQLHDTMLSHGSPPPRQPRTLLGLAAV